MLPTLSPAPPEAPDRGVPIRAAEAMAYGFYGYCRWCRLPARSPYSSVKPFRPLRLST